MLLYSACCELDNKRRIVRLDLCLVRRLISYDRAASVASVDNNVSLLRIGLGLDGAQNSSAVVCSVAGVYIYV